jgi:hypothetical protein
MTTIQGVLQDSGLGVFDAKLYITLDSPISIDTTPKTLLVPKTKIINITDGIINFSLEESETDQITYTFVLYEVNSLDEIIEPALLTFKAIVPNETSVDFVDLAPTGFITSQLDSGAKRISKLIINNPFFNTGIKDLTKPVISVKSSSSQSISSSTTALIFNTEILDSNGVWDDDKFTVPSGFGGSYVFSGVIPLTNNSGANRVITLATRVNNSVVGEIISYVSADNTTADFVLPTSVINLNPGDTLEIVLITVGGFTLTSISARKQLNVYRLAV